MSNGVKFELKLLAAILFLSLAVSVIAESILLGSCLGLFLYLAWHLYQLLRLIELIRRRQHIRSPYPPGWWGEVYEVLEQTQASGRKRKKEMLQFASRFLKAATAIPYGMVILDENRKISWANPAAEHLVGISFSLHEGKRILDLLRYPFLEEYLSAGEFERPLEYPSPDGSGMVLSLQIISFGKKEIQQLLIIRDITQIYNLNQIRKDFVDNVSHELKTPLTVLTGFVEQLMDAPKYPVQERPLLLMQQQALRMESTINDLLTLSRIELGQGSRSEKLVPVSKMLLGMVEEARSLSGTQNHSFVLQIDPLLGMLGNESELRSTFSNLIFNAVKYTPPRAEIRITWIFEDWRARFVVRDSGEGIPARHIPRLTERFYRVDRGRSRETGGTGLGLAIVKHGVSQHGGRLDIQSKVGMGSIFRCDFSAGIFCFLPEP